jgi:hypothetical protein
MYVLSSMSITATKATVLSKLHANRESHKKVVAEARAGYVTRARAALEKKLRLVAEGKIVSLAFSLKPPLDYSTVYDTAIRMLELHTGDTIQLDSAQVRSLIEDQWDWSRDFLVSNSAYSQTAKAQLGSVVEEDEE